MEISIKAEEVLHFLHLPITNSILLTLLVSAFLIIGSIAIKRGLSIIPSKIQNLVEVIFDGLINFLAEILGSLQLAQRYFPFIATIFIFVLINNWFGILPILGTVGVFHEGEHGSILIPFFRSAASDINTTLALSIISVFVTHIFGVSALGIVQYGKKYLNFSGIIPFYVGILELIAEVAKMISFSFRLFGNIFAGEVLLTIIASLAPILVPVPFLGLEIFVGFVQALVFTMLTTVFIKLAITPHEHEGEHGHK